VGREPPVAVASRCKFGHGVWGKVRFPGRRPSSCVCACPSRPVQQGCCGSSGQRKQPALPLSSSHFEDGARVPLLLSEHPSAAGTVPLPAVQGVPTRQVALDPGGAKGGTSGAGAGSAAAPADTTSLYAQWVAVKRGLADSSRLRPWVEDLAEVGAVSHPPHPTPNPSFPVCSPPLIEHVTRSVTPHGMHVL
jgi:hypothetical protein